MLHEDLAVRAAAPVGAARGAARRHPRPRRVPLGRLARAPDADHDADPADRRPVRGCCSDQLPQPLAEKVARRLDVTRRQVDRLAALVSTLIDVSRITSGRVQLSRQLADLVEIARSVAGAARRRRPAQRLVAPLRAAGPGVGQLRRLARRPGADQPAVERDPLRARQADRGRRRPGERDSARFWVEDQGIGIPPEHQARIFQHYERAAPSTSYAGLGLGLWISRQLVEAMGGTISVRSEVDVGSVFTVEIPRAG